MERLFVNPKFANAFARRGWNSFSGVFAHFFPTYTRRQKMMVERITIQTPQGDVPAFFKLYHHARSGWNFWMRRSKARCEFENYEIFERLGVPAAERIACGEERNGFGKLKRAFIITRAVPHASELDDFFRAAPRTAQRRRILKELAHMVHRLHAADFFYYDLVWRNILVSREAPENEARVFLLDCPRGGVAQFAKNRKRLRDLASLDKTAAQLCSRTDRLRFLLQYLGLRRLNDDAKTLARDCIAYRRTRWPEDWPTPR